MKKPTAWSYSALTCHTNCPRQYLYRNVEKREEPKSPAMYNGIKVHNEAAKWLASEEVNFPSSCIGFKDLLHELRDMHPIVEQRWAFTENWKPTAYFARDVWVRVIADAAVIYDDGTADVVDHKTGKRYDDDYTKQLALFAHATMSMHPQVNEVTTRLWYLDSGDEVIEEFTKKSAAAYVKDLERDARVMLKDKRYPPNPSWRCKFCHFRRENGGPCDY